MEAPAAELVEAWIPTVPPEFCTLTVGLVVPLERAYTAMPLLLSTSTPDAPFVPMAVTAGFKGLLLEKLPVASGVAGG
jgi:hypothetical protein